LFPAQIAAIESGVLGEGSKLVAMPTSSGKTFLAELRIAAELARTSGSRAVYLAPYRVLANQVASALQYGLGRLNLKSVDLGGAYDVSLDELFQNDELPDVAVMTPERFDALLRLADSGRRGHAAAAELLESLSLIVLDEVQLIGRPHRGAKYELFLTRVRQRLPSVSILGLAALSQGEVNLAEWLEATLTVPNSGRPTGLIEVLWKPDGSLYQRFEGKQVRVGVVQRDGTAIDAAARLMASMRPESCPVLCVEVTRDYAESVIRKVAHASPRAGDRWRASLTANRRAVLDEVASIASAMLGEQHELGELIRQGLAYHHAGLPSNLLREIENLLRHRLVRALGATTTVAEGADLPFQVLIIPHLNFGGQSARLDRELYQNIVGRAGRVNASIEGIVIVLGSNSPSFRNFVEDELWAQTGRRTLVGQLPAALSLDSRLEDYRVQREVRSQVLAWVGDPGSYSDDQARTLAAKTFSWRTTTHRQRETLEAGVHNVLLSLVESGLAEVGSPFQLTELGQRARLAGIGPASCLRLASALQRIGLEESVATLQEAARVNLLMSRVIGELLFETEEVMEHSLWLRRQGFQDGELVPHHDGYWG
jgi:helicase